MKPGGGFFGPGRPVHYREISCNPHKYWSARWPVAAIVLAVILALAGCAGQVVDQPAPQVVRVEVPVQVPCRTERVPRPAFAVDALRIGAPNDEQMRALRAERKQRKADKKRLEAAVEACQ